MKFARGFIKRHGARQAISTSLFFLIGMALIIHLNVTGAVVTPVSAETSTGAAGVGIKHLIQKAFEPHDSAELVCEAGEEGEGSCPVSKPLSSSDMVDLLENLGIGCEDAKDLQALALGTYGNLLLAVSKSPDIIECPPQSRSGSMRTVSPEGRGESEGTGE